MAQMSNDASQVRSCADSGLGTSSNRFDKPQARVCTLCGKPKGCFSFRFVRDGVWVRDYFHPPCFAKMQAEKSL